MPWGLYRFHQSRLPHFITFTCYRRQSFLDTPTVRDAFLGVLERTRLRDDFLVYGFVVMPNHVHLLISEPKQGTIATVIQSLKISLARYEKTHISQKKADMGHKAVRHDEQATPCGNGVITTATSATTKNSSKRSSTSTAIP